MSAEVLEVRVTERPQKGRTVSGYGGAIPTSYLVRVKGVRGWRRVRVAQYGNAGSAYVTVRSVALFINDFALEGVRASRG